MNLSLTITLNNGIEMPRVGLGTYRRAFNEALRASPSPDTSDVASFSREPSYIESPRIGRKSLDWDTWPVGRMAHACRASGGDAKVHHCGIAHIDTAATERVAPVAHDRCHQISMQTGGLHRSGFGVGMHAEGVGWVVVCIHTGQSVEDQSNEHIPLATGDRSRVQRNRPSRARIDQARASNPAV